LVVIIRQREPRIYARERATALRALDIVTMRVTLLLALRSRRALV